MKTNTAAAWPYNEAWKLQVGACPCDVDFTAFLKARAIKNARIFHFGTGDHHHVGTTCAKDGSGNLVFGITASEQEHDSYVRLAVADPALLNSYQVVFGDIYRLNYRLLPRFDIAFLPHVGEYARAAGADYALLCEFATQMPDGLIVLYNRSRARRPEWPVDVNAEIESWAGKYARQSEQFATLTAYLC